MTFSNSNPLKCRKNQPSNNTVFSKLHKIYSSKFLKNNLSRKLHVLFLQRVIAKMEVIVKTNTTWKQTKNRKFHANFSHQEHAYIKMALTANFHMTFLHKFKLRWSSNLKLKTESQKWFNKFINKNLTRKLTRKRKCNSKMRNSKWRCLPSNSLNKRRLWSFKRKFMIRNLWRSHRCKRTTKL